MTLDSTSTHSIDRGAAERAAIERWEGEGGRSATLEESRVARSDALPGLGYGEQSQVRVSRG